MKAIPRVGWMLLMLTIAAQAQPMPTPIAHDPVWIPATPPRDVSDRITRVEFVWSGAVHYDPPVSPLAFSLAYYDSISNPCGDPNGPLNFSYADAGGAPLCTCPVDPAAVAMLAVDPISADPCDDPNQSPASVVVFPGLGISDPLDLRWDDYVAEWTLQDPNEIAQYRRFEFSFSLPPAPATIGQPYVVSMTLGTFERFDNNGDGQFAQIDGVTLDFFLEPNDPGGVCTAGLDLDVIDFNTPAMFGYGAGLLMIDAGNALLDPITRMPLQPACGIGLPLAGGVPDVPGCVPPEQWITAGANFLPPDNLLLAANDTQGAGPGPPWDPNTPIAAADPLAPTYEEILNNGLLIQVDRGLAPGYAFRLDTSDNCSCTTPCGAGCEIPGGCADSNGDGGVDLTDLANVLADFGGGSSIGDLNRDGVVDLTDLANVLALFGAACR